MIDAVVFDLDGVLMDSEQLWDQARRETVAAHGGHWPPGATEAMQGMSSPEWSHYLEGESGVDLTADQIVGAVLEKLLGYYQQGLPLLPGAADAVRRMGQSWPLGLASSSNRSVIDGVLVLAGLTDLFRATVSSEEVNRGKPAPDVYLEAARRLGVPAPRCAAVEDSANGIRSASSAAMCVLALPNPHFPPAPEVVASSDLILSNLGELTVENVRRADEVRRLRTGRASP